jgi:chromosome partitioning protein
MHPKLFLGDIARIEKISVAAIHNRVKDQQVKYNDYKGRAYVTPDIVKKLLKKNITKQKIVVHTTKGGVGKTTITQNLAYRFSSFGAKVLVIDLDQQGNLTSGLTGEDINQYKTIQDVLEGTASFNDVIKPIIQGIDLIPSNLKNAQNTQYMTAYGISPGDFLPAHIANIENKYDIILIDCPPSLGHIIQSAYLACDRVLSVLDPDSNALHGVKHSLSETKKYSQLKKKNIKFNIVLNKYDARTVFSNVMLNNLINDLELKGLVLETILSTSQEYIKANELRETIFDFSRRHKAYIEMDNLARELLGWGITKD